MYATVCDVCGKVVGDNKYQLEIRKHKKEDGDVTLWTNLYQKDMCQKCFLKVEAELRRLMKNGRL